MLKYSEITVCADCRTTVRSETRKVEVLGLSSKPIGRGKKERTHSYAWLMEKLASLQQYSFVVQS